MVPRLQPQSLAWATRQVGVCERALFSTSSRTLADLPPNSVSKILSTGKDTPSYRGIQLPNNRRKLPSSRGALQPGNANANSQLLSLVDRQRQRSAPTDSKLTTAEDVAKHHHAQDLTKQIARRWKSGDVYAPHDLSPIEMQKWKKRERPDYDVFDVLNMNPMVEYKNISIINEYMTPMGRIRHPNETGLRPVNQRRIARAIRRSIGIGLTPSVHRHPEILQKEARRRNEILSRRSG